MKVLICSTTPLNPKLGGPQHLMSLGRELENCGCRTLLIDRDSIFRCARRPASSSQADYAEALRDYLLEHAASYDVVDYDHGSLPYSRRIFARKTLFVARSYLSLFFLDRIRFPIFPRLRSYVGASTVGLRRLWEIKQSSRRALITCREADLVNVLTEDERREVARRGKAGDKIAVIPNGLSSDLLAALGKTGENLSEEKRVAFIGTFDTRKGAAEIPRIAADIAAQIPSVKFRLIGTLRGGKEDIVRHFHRDLRDRVEVIPEFEREELPNLLRGCTAGMFPSYLEGFPLALLEMLAAYVPTVGYDSPGVSAVLDEDLLVPRGDAPALARKLLALLNDRNLLVQKREWSRQRAASFTWSAAANATVTVYSSALERLRRS